MNKKGKYDKWLAMSIVKPVINVDKSIALQRRSRKEAYYIKSNVLGLKRLGAVDYLKNILHIKIIFHKEARR